MKCQSPYGHHPFSPSAKSWMCRSYWQSLMLERHIWSLHRDVWQWSANGILNLPLNDQPCAMGWPILLCDGIRKNRTAWIKWNMVWFFHKKVTKVLPTIYAQKQNIHINDKLYFFHQFHFYSKTKKKKQKTCNFICTWYAFIKNEVYHIRMNIRIIFFTCTLLTC